MGKQKGWAGWYLDGKCVFNQGRFASELKAIVVEKYDADFGLMLRAEVDPRYFSPTRIYMGYIKGVIFKDHPDITSMAKAYSYWCSTKEVHVITAIFVSGFPVWKSSRKTIEEFPSDYGTIKPEHYPDPKEEVTGFKDANKC